MNPTAHLLLLLLFLLLSTFLTLAGSNAGYIKIEVTTKSDASPSGFGDVVESVAYGVLREKPLLPQIVEICTNIGLLSGGREADCRRSAELLVMCSDDRVFKRFSVGNDQSSSTIIIKVFITYSYSLT